MEDRVNTRDIARHLYRYNAFLLAEAKRAEALSFLDDDKSGEIEREAEAVQELANYLHELKEWIEIPNR